MLYTSKIANPHCTTTSELIRHWLTELTAFTPQQVAAIVSDNKYSSDKKCIAHYKDLSPQSKEKLN